MLLVTIFTFVVANNLTTYLVALLFSIIWLIFTIYGYYVILIKKKQTLVKLSDSNKKGLFDRHIELLQMQYESIKSREKFFKEDNEDTKLVLLYDEILEQVELNIKSATAFIESYDYVTKPDPVYITNLIKQGNNLVEKFNKLVQQMVELDIDTHKLDVKYIDDIISCMEEIKNGGTIL